MSLINVEVLCEDTGKIVHLNLTPEDYQRVLVDSEYLQHVVAQHRNSQATSQTAQLDNRISQESDEPRQLEDSGENSSLFIWTNSAVLLLLSVYEEHIQEFNVKRHKKVWEDIAKLLKETNPALTVTGYQCQTKLNGLKRTYKKILDHNNTSGNDRASWPFFKRMHELFGGNSWAQPLAVVSEMGPFPSTSQSNENRNNEDQLNKNQENTRPNKKRKLDSILEKYITEMKTYNEKKREERKERFDKFMEMKEKHHREKMIILKELFWAIVANTTR